MRTNIYGNYGNFFTEAAPRLIGRNTSVPCLGTSSTITVSTAASADQLIHFSLCRTEGRSSFHGLSCRCEVGITGGNRTIKYALFEADRSTGNPGTSAIYRDAFTIPSGASYGWRHFTSSGTPIIESEYFWLATQLPPSGFTAGQIYNLLGVNAGLTFSSRTTDFYVTRPGTAFDYTTGIPNDILSLSGATVTNYETTVGGSSPFCTVNWGLLLKRLQ